MERKGKRSASAKRKSRARFSYIIAFLPAAVFVGLIVFLLLQPPTAPPPVSTLTQVTNRGAAPDFTLNKLTAEGLSEEKFTLSSTRGKVVFLDFSWWRCPHCNNMEPVIKELYSEFSGRGVEFVTIMIDDRQSSIADNAGFVARNQIPWTVVWDEGGRVSSLYGVKGTPTYIVIDESGNIVRVVSGEQPKQFLASILNSALG
ncbi:MAG: TlpA disulfide reductase family protein [Nitrososphaerota archaeon]